MTVSGVTGARVLFWLILRKIMSAVCLHYMGPGELGIKIVRDQLTIENTSSLWRGSAVCLQFLTRARASVTIVEVAICHWPQIPIRLLSKYQGMHLWSYAKKCVGRDVYARTLKVRGWQIGMRNVQFTVLLERPRKKGPDGQKVPSNIVPVMMAINWLFGHKCFMKLATFCFRLQKQPGCFDRFFWII